MRNRGELNGRLSEPERHNLIGYRPIQLEEPVTLAERPVSRKSWGTAPFAGFSEAACPLVGQPDRRE